jgi:hypothetical protein
MAKERLPVATTRLAILRHWSPWLAEHGIESDEPSCWACGYFWWWRHSNYRTAEAGWNKAPLNKCHIIADSLGGPDSPENLFLMCNECHDRAPNTSSRDAFLKWAIAQRNGPNNWANRQVRELTDALSDAGLAAMDSDDLSALMRARPFRDWCQNNMALHRSRKGAQLTFATVCAALSEYMGQQSACADERRIAPARADVAGHSSAEDPPGHQRQNDPPEATTEDVSDNGLQRLLPKIREFLHSVDKESVEMNKQEPHLLNGGCWCGHKNDGSPGYDPHTFVFVEDTQTESDNFVIRPKEVVCRACDPSIPEE